MRHRWNLTALFLPALLLTAPLAAQATPGDAYRATSDSTRAVGEPYKNAYVTLDWDALEGLLGEEASFQDPTAKLIFGGLLTSGREAMMNKFRNGNAGIQMSFVETRAIYTGHYAIFEGELSWSSPMQDGRRVSSKDTPFVLVLKVEGGKVVEHRDYADYHPFLDAMAAM